MGPCPQGTVCPELFPWLCPTALWGTMSLALRGLPELPGRPWGLSLSETTLSVGAFWLLLLETAGWGGAGFITVRTRNGTWPMMGLSTRKAEAGARACEHTRGGVGSTG